jgi:hypothetical protein
MNTSNKEYKSAVFGFTINPNEKISKRGVSLIIVKETPTHVEGVRLLFDGNTNFSIHKDELEKLIQSKELIFIEFLPNFVFKTMEQIFNNNFQLEKNKVS